MRRFWPPCPAMLCTALNGSPEHTRPKRTPCTLPSQRGCVRPESTREHRRTPMNPITMFLTIVALLIGLLLLAVRLPVPAGAFFVIAVLVFASLKMANTWERFVILRAGRLQGVEGPGLFWIIPILDSVTAVIDQRIQTTAF